MHRYFDFTLVIFFAITVSWLLWACSPTKNEKKTVTVSILPLRYLVHQIGGSLVDVQVMVPAGTSPEAYDPTPQDLMKTSHSSLYFAVGDFGFENVWLGRIANQNPGMKIVNTSADIRRIAIDDDETDPHVWTSPSNMKLMARVVCDALIADDSAHAPIYQENLKCFEQKMDSINHRIGQLLNIGQSHTFVIYHPALSYLSAEFKLTQIAIEREHKEPSAAMMMQIVKEVKAGDARVILMQQEFDVRLVETLASETGLRIVQINPLSEDWETELMKIALEIGR